MAGNLGSVRLGGTSPDLRPHQIFLVLHSTPLPHSLSTLPLHSPHLIILIIETLKHILGIRKSMHDLLPLFNTSVSSHTIKRSFSHYLCIQIRIHSIGTIFPGPKMHAYVDFHGTRPIYQRMGCAQIGHGVFVAGAVFVHLMVVAYPWVSSLRCSSGALGR